MFQEYQNNKLVMFNKTNFRDKKEYIFDDAGNIPAFEELKRELDQLKQDSAKNKQEFEKNKQEFEKNKQEFEDNIQDSAKNKQELEELKQEFEKNKQEFEDNKQEINSVNNQFPPLVIEWEEFEKILIPKLDNVYLDFKNDEPIHGIKINKGDNQHDRNKYDITIYHSYEKIINIICHNDVYYITAYWGINPLLGYQTKTITYFKKIASITLDINIFQIKNTYLYLVILADYKSNGELADYTSNGEHVTRKNYAIIDYDWFCRNRRLQSDTIKEKIYNNNSCKYIIKIKNTPIKDLVFEKDYTQKDYDFIYSKFILPILER
jgi:hypothetical protein